MASQTLNRYIWILNTLIKHRELTFEEIAERWLESELCNGKPMALRTFHDHRKAILELFGVEIKCNTSNGYRYYVGSLDSLRQDRFRNWLFNSFSLSNMLQASHNLKDRILFENIPKGTEYLQTIIEAMREGKVLQLDYQRFGGKSRETFHIEVYALKMYHLRWYILGNIRKREGLRHLSLDRFLEVKFTKEKYTIPENFNAEKLLRQQHWHICRPQPCTPECPHPRIRQQGGIPSHLTPSQESGRGPNQTPPVQRIPIPALPHTRTHHPNPLHGK